MRRKARNLRVRRALRSPVHTLGCVTPIHSLSQVKHTEYSRKTRSPLPLVIQSFLLSLPVHESEADNKVSCKWPLVSIISL